MRPPAFKGEEVGLGHPVYNRRNKIHQKGNIVDNLFVFKFQKPQRKPLVNNSSKCAERRVDNHWLAECAIVKVVVVDVVVEQLHNSMVDNCCHVAVPVVGKR